MASNRKRSAFATKDGEDDPKKKSIKKVEKGWLEKVDDVLSAPSRAATYAVTSVLSGGKNAKYVDPSIAIGIDEKEHPYLKLATDIVLDPMNLVGVGAIGKLGKLAKGIKTIEKTKVVQNPARFKEAMEVFNAANKANVASKTTKLAKLGAKIDASAGHKAVAELIKKTGKGVSYSTKNLGSEMGQYSADLVKTTHKISAYKNAARVAAPVVNDLINTNNSSGNSNKPVGNEKSNKGEFLNGIHGNDYIRLPDGRKVYNRRSDEKDDVVIPGYKMEFSDKYPEGAWVEEKPPTRPKYNVDKITPRDATANTIVDTPFKLDAIPEEPNTLLKGKKVIRIPSSEPRLANDNLYAKYKVVEEEYVPNDARMRQKGKKILPKMGMGGFFKKAGQFAGNHGKFLADTAMSTVGMKDVIEDSDYKGAGSNFYKGASGVSEVVMPIAGQAAAAYFGGPMGLQAATTLQSTGANANSGIVQNRENKLIDQEMAVQAAMTEEEAIKNRTRAYSGNGYFKYGGRTAAAYEAEKGEVALGDNVSMEEGRKLASDVHLFGGDKHEQGGTDGAGGEFIYSDRLKSSSGSTFAKEAERLGKKKGKLEKKLNGDDVAKATAERMLGHIDSDLNSLAIEQETMKQNKPRSKFATMADGGVPTTYEDIVAEQTRLKGLGLYTGKVDGDWGPLSQSASTQWNSLNVPVDNGLARQASIPMNNANYVDPNAANNAIIGDAPVYNDKLRMSGNTAPTTSSTGSEGGGMGSYIGIAASGLDNIANAIISSKTPRVPRPRLNSFIPIEDKVNVQPQLNSIAASTSTYYDNVDNNSMDSNTARSNKQSAFARSLDTTAQVYNAKDAAERDARNRNITSANAVNASNNAKLDEHALLNMQRRSKMLQDQSENWANLGSDIYTASRDAKMDANDIEKTKIIAAADPDSYQYLANLETTKNQYKNKADWDAKMRNVRPGSKGYEILMQYGKEFGHVK